MTVHEKTKDRRLVRQQSLDFRQQDLQRLLTRQYDRNSYGMPIRDSEAPLTLENSEELKTQMQAKWHPLTHAIYNGNLGLVRYLFAECKVNSKKAVKVPGLFSTNEVNKLFPFYVALSSASNEDMFNYFWNEQRQLQWTEDSFDGLFKLLAKREASHFITPLFRSQTTLSLFLAMSFSYRFAFMERILSTQGEILDEINQMLQ